VEGIFLVSDDNGMAGVISTLIADNIINAIA
jgi:hypothetical protein